MGVVNNNREAHVKIEVKETPEWPDYDVWILLTVLSTVLVIVLIFIVRLRCRPNRAQTHVQEETLRAISQLATRRYQARRPRPRHHPPTGDSVSTCSSAPVCAICLEEFSEGQELRIITCFHEFHRQCVDPWLEEHQTCPLCMLNILMDQDHRSAVAVPHPREHPHRLGGPGRRQQRHFIQQPAGRALYHFPRTLPPRPPRNCPSRLPHGHPFFHSPELSQLDPLGTMRYLPYRSVGFDPQYGHQPPPPRGGLLAPQQQQESPLGEQALPPHQPSCPLQRQPSCRGLRAPLAAKLSRAVALQRGLRHHGRHHHHRSSSGDSGESYYTEPSGYLPDGPGSDSSSGPCHGSSSDSMLNCTDVSLQALHGSCSTFHGSLSSDYDPFAFCDSEKVAAPENHPNPPPSSPRDLRSPVLGSAMTGSRTQLTSNHVHYHHHHHRHHHYGLGAPDCPRDGTSQEAGQRKAKDSRAKAGAHCVQGPNRTEKMPGGQEGNSSSSQHVSLIRQAASCLPLGLGPHWAETPDFSLAATGPQTSPKPYLQIHPSRKKWKEPLDAAQSSLPEDANRTPGCRVPPRFDPTAGSRCSPEMQPLVSSASPPSLRGFVCAPQHSSLQSRLMEFQEQVEPDCDKPMFPGQHSGRDTMGNNMSVDLSCQILQHLQRVPENISDLYEHSV